MDLPDITPRIVAPDVVMLPRGFILGPLEGIGPLALILSVREDTGQRVTTFIAAEILHPLIETDADGGEGLDLTQVDPDLFCRATVVGWPDEWAPGGPGQVLANGMAAALLAGTPWHQVRARAERLAALSTASLN
jgi:hypothetical protein